jgi:hypothetical protein
MHYPIASLAFFAIFNRHKVKLNSSGESIMKALTIALVLTFYPLVSPLNAQPKIAVEGEKVLSLDTLMEGTVAERKVPIRNAGTEELTIEKVDASCGCTGAMVSENTLKPGETGELLISFNSKNFNGKVHKTVTVSSNDPETPKTRIEFTAFVVQEVAMSENRFVFKDAVVGQKQTSKVTITNNGTKKLEFKGYETSLVGLTVNYPHELSPGQSAEVVAEFVPKEARRTLSSNVLLQTTSNSKPEITLLVFGNVKEWKFE